MMIGIGVVGDVYLNRLNCLGYAVEKIDEDTGIYG